ncbi:MAG TPA: hypothetical protein VMC03_20050 [Streptosporangiaceae bacterium]|nr:hypothetical protein [Streptosporangiaceae bacterium]
MAQTRWQSSDERLYGRAFEEWLGGEIYGHIKPRKARARFLESRSAGDQVLRLAG